MVSPKVKINNAKKNEDKDLNKLQISPSANNTKHLQSGGGNRSQRNSKEDRYGRKESPEDAANKKKFRNLLAAECQELKN